MRYMRIRWKTISHSATFTPRLSAAVSQYAPCPPVFFFGANQNINIPYIYPNLCQVIQQKKSNFINFSRKKSVFMANSSTIDHYDVNLSDKNENLEKKKKRGFRICSSFRSSNLVKSTNKYPNVQGGTWYLAPLHY